MSSANVEQARVVDNLRGMHFTEDALLEAGWERGDYFDDCVTFWMGRDRLLLWKPTTGEVEEDLTIEPSA